MLSAISIGITAKPKGVFTFAALEESAKIGVPLTSTDSPPPASLTVPVSAAARFTPETNSLVCFPALFLASSSAAYVLIPPVIAPATPPVIAPPTIEPATLLSVADAVPEPTKPATRFLVISDSLPPFNAVIAADEPAETIASVTAGFEITLFISCAIAGEPVETTAVVTAFCNASSRGLPCATCTTVLARALETTD